MKKNKRITAFFKSLKFRLMALILVITFLPAFVLYEGVLYSYVRRAVSIRESEVLSQAKIVANQVSTSKYMTDTDQSTETIQTQISMLTTIYDGRVMIVNNA